MLVKGAMESSMQLQGGWGVHDSYLYRRSYNYRHYTSKSLRLIVLSQ